MADLDANAIHAVTELVKKAFEPRRVTLDAGPFAAGRTLELVPNHLWAAEKLIPEEPCAEPLELSTLDSLVGYVMSDPKAHENHLLHVVSPEEVRLISPLKGYHREREVLAVSRLHRTGFPFGRFVSLEEFVISAMVQFAENVETDKALVLGVAGNVKQEAVRTSADDGVSQTATTRVGITRGQETPVPKTVMLAPYRTFSEVEQPVSPFLFRLRGGSPNELPQAALFEADGGAWRLEATRRIADYLRQALKPVGPQLRILF
jgi:hypothetical protein